MPMRPRGAAPFHNTTVKMTWHHGRIMHHSVVHPFFWDPTYNATTDTGAFPAGYITTVLQYFHDVVAASGKTTNVYSVTPQYKDATGRAKYKVTDPELCDGSVCSRGPILTDAYPTSGGCPIVAPFTTCITDNQLRDEIDAARIRFGFPTGLADISFMFLPAGVDVCAGTYCASNYYCAYHWYFDRGAGKVLYAAQPDSHRSTYPMYCATGQNPNNNDADDTLNSVDHEHIETITDPDVATGWYHQNTAGEIGDLCNFRFGAAKGAVGEMYNQTINGHHYYIQTEWSNARHGCRKHK